MKHLFLNTILVGAFLSMVPSVLAGRTFTSKEGKELEAEIVTATKTTVTLKKKADGKDYTIPLERLSDADQAFVRDWLAKVERNTRPERELTLVLEGGGEKVVKIPKGEYLDKDGVLTIYPGDTIHLEFEEKDGKLGNPQVVESVGNAERTITLKMSQGEKITMLYRSTKIRQTVAMDCEHRGLGSDKFFRTNLFPSEKGLAGGDSWPNTVWTLRLSNFEVTDRPASKVYEERVAK